MKNVSFYILLIAILLIFLALGAIWVITNLIAILKVVLPLAIVGAAIGGMIVGWKLRGRFIKSAIG